METGHLHKSECSTNTHTTLHHIHTEAVDLDDKHDGIVAALTHLQTSVHTVGTPLLSARDTPHGLPLLHGQQRTKVSEFHTTA